MYKRVIAVLIATLVAIAGLVGPASAGAKGGGNPHFVKVEASVDTEGNLVVDFKEAGLGKKRAVEVHAKALATVKYVCVTKDKKTGEHEVVSKHKFSKWVHAADERTKASGSYRGSITLEAPEYGKKCDNGEEAVLIFIKWKYLHVWDVCTGAKAFKRGPWWYFPSDEEQDNDCGCPDFDKIA